MRVRRAERRLSLALVHVPALNCTQRLLTMKMLLLSGCSLLFLACDQAPQKGDVLSRDSTPRPALPDSDLANVNPRAQGKPTTTARTARFASVSDAQREAVKRYPDVGVSGSKLNTEFLRLYNRLKAEKPGYFSDNAWPVSLARQAYRDICSKVETILENPRSTSCVVRLDEPLPPSDEVDLIVREVLDEAISTHPDNDVLAWASLASDGKTLRSNSLPGPYQYSGSLSYRAASKKIKTEADIDYENGLRITSAQRNGYFLETRRHEMLQFKSSNKYIHLHLVFRSPLTLNEADAAMRVEIETRPEKDWDISAYIMIGDARNRASWKQMPNPDGARGWVAATYMPTQRRILFGNTGNPRWIFDIPK